MRSASRSSGEVFPRSYVKQEQCFLADDLPLPPSPQCGEACLGDGCIPQPGLSPIPGCRQSVKDPSVKFCADLSQHKYLLWQAFIGESGGGPAFEATVTGPSGTTVGHGVVRLWSYAPALTPHDTTQWDMEVKIPLDEIKEFFSLLDSITYAKLPHTTIKPYTECTPSFYYEPCDRCQPERLDNYVSATNLSPEFDGIFQWIMERPELVFNPLSPVPQLPLYYCEVF